MTALHPTILATSGGFRRSRRLSWEIAPLAQHAVALARVSGRAPRICFLPTAAGDDPRLIMTFYDNAWRHGWTASHLSLVEMPNIDDPAEHLLTQDVVWVSGGSVAALLAMWRLHGLDVALRQAWESGVVLTGVSAGSICWHAGGTTDSFGPELRPVTNGLGFLPYSNGVHHDTEAERRPVLHELIAAGTLPPGFATDDGAGLHYRGTDLHEVVAETPGAYGYEIERASDGTVNETRLPVRLL
ncbi:peptidase E [Pseudonocardia sp. HH130630-07]|uniref:Type 1 glutamine amidotransferase-like domain-containing protein n=1 Tax=Pseudonocardia sp. HH130630-07 TaxID=1690815 RepID=UPI000814FB8B|nr:peptidase E [Pseudonocardia sp. HH130630-07]ANY10768.1 peptidase [Pseudonocardia sp. HH130630-07]